MANNTEKPLHSHHIFLFPFEWRFPSAAYKLMEEKTDITEFHRRMSQHSAQWERRQSWLEPTAILQYNEAVYFYDFVRAALYDTGKEQTLLAHYYFNLPSPNTEYVIELTDRSYRLEVDDIVLSVYNTGVGVLAFHLNNKRQDQTAPSDILHINQYGRRLYPPFFKSNTDLIGTQAFFEDKNWQRGLTGVQELELAKSLALEANGKTWIKDDFSEWAIQPRLDTEPGLIRQLLPTNLVRDVKITPVLDDRMFVVCWYGNDVLSQKLQKGNAAEGYKNDEWWYRFIFVDGGSKTCQNDEMTKQFLTDHTNARWDNYGTFYGVSRYSLVCLTDSMTTNAFAKVICSHVQTIYYKIALLSLIQRACVLRFSEEVTAISQLPPNDPMIGRKVSSLYRQYLRFINKIYFREVTAQEQGIEIYDLLQKHMRLKEQTQELETEIQELQNYANLVEESIRNDKLALLTYIGALLIGPSFVVSFLGIDSDLFTLEPSWKWISVSLLCLVFAVLAIGIVRGSRKWRIVFLVLVSLLLLFFLFAYIYLIY